MASRAKDPHERCLPCPVSVSCRTGEKTIASLTVYGYEYLVLHLREFLSHCHFIPEECMFWTTAAYAMSGAPAGGAAGGDPGLGSFVPIILMFAVFYFLLIRPQQKRTKEHKAMLSSLKRGDEVITAGGIFGRIQEITDEYAILDVGGTHMKVLRSSISTFSSNVGKAPDKKAAKKGESGNAKKDEPKKLGLKKDEARQDEKADVNAKEDEPENK